MYHFVTDLVNNLALFTRLRDTRVDRMLPALRQGTKFDMS